MTTQATDAARSTTPAPRSLAALELFAGAGGMAIGVHRAGFELLDLIESSEACCATLRANAHHFGWKDASEISPRDIRTQDFSGYLGRVDLVAAGAPCQPFSHGGQRRGEADERNLLPEVVRVIRECRPRAFIIENVRGLLFRASIAYLESIITELRNPSLWKSDITNEQRGLASHPRLASEDDEYAVEYKLLNAADFGLAQYRPRLFIVGVARGENWAGWPEGEFSRAALVADLLGGSYWSEHPDTPKAARARACQPFFPVESLDNSVRWRTLRDLSVELGPPATSLRTANDVSHVHVPGARLYGKHTGSRIDWVSKTVKAGVHGSPGGEHIVVSSAKRFRYLTVRECSHLQGFPHDYVLPERRTPAMRQLGNAVPVEVADALVRTVHQSLALERALVGSRGA